MTYGDYRSARAARDLDAMHESANNLNVEYKEAIRRDITRRFGPAIAYATLYSVGLASAFVNVVEDFGVGTTRFVWRDDADVVLSPEMPHAVEVYQEHAREALLLTMNRREPGPKIHTTLDPERLARLVAPGPSHLTHPSIGDEAAMLARQINGEVETGKFAAELWERAVRTANYILTDRYRPVTECELELTFAIVPDALRALVKYR